MSKRYKERLITCHFDRREKSANEIIDSCHNNIKIAQVSTTPASAEDLIYSPANWYLFTITPQSYGVEPSEVNF